MHETTFCILLGLLIVGRWHFHNWIHTTRVFRQHLSPLLLRKGQQIPVIDIIGTKSLAMIQFAEDAAKIVIVGLFIEA